MPRKMVFEFFTEHVNGGENLDIEMVPTKVVAQVEHQQPAQRQIAQGQPHQGGNEAGHGGAGAGPPAPQPDHGAAATNAGVPAAPPAGPAVAREQPPIAPPPAEPAPAAQNVSLVIDSARLNEWFQTGPDGNGGFWPKSIRLSIDNQALDLASNLAGASPNIPAFSKTVSVRKGSHHYVFRVELDEKVAKKFNLGSTHESIFPECAGDIQAEHDMKATPFVTVRATKIMQCKLLADSDPIPDRTQ